MEENVMIVGAQLFSVRDKYADAQGIKTTLN